jgi:hypothetical protein
MNAAGLAGRRRLGALMMMMTFKTCYGGYGALF